MCVRFEVVFVYVSCVIVRATIAVFRVFLFVYQSAFFTTSDIDYTIVDV